MTNLVLGHPGPVAIAVAEKLAASGSRVTMIGESSTPIRDDIVLIPGDAAKIDFGLSGQVYGALLREIRAIYVAESLEQLSDSELRFRDLESARLVRVASEVVEFARSSSNLQHLSYLSSLSVFGDYQGIVSERDFEIGQSFSRKNDEIFAVAEKQLLRLPSTLPRAIVRIANLAGFETSGEVLVGAELGRLARFAQAAPNACEFSFSDAAVHFETVERATQVLIFVQPSTVGAYLHLIDDEPWTDRLLVEWMFARLLKSVVEIPKGMATVGQLLRAATTQSGRVRTSRVSFQRDEAVLQFASLLSSPIERRLNGLFGQVGV